MAFFATTDTGVTLNRFSQDLMLIDMELPVSALNTFASKLQTIRTHLQIARADVALQLSFCASARWP
jgi:ATP-binding cassette subfamily C (CFTR/MRP) protein 1